MTAPRTGETSDPAGLRLRLGVRALLGLLAVFALLQLAPLSAGAARVFGVSLSWWYAGAVAPLLAVLITLGCVTFSGPDAPAWLPAMDRVSIWFTPALLFFLPVELLTGGRRGLWIVLLVVVAPLLSALLRTRRAVPSHPAVSFVLVLMGVVLLWASLLLVGDMVQSLGFPRLPAVLVAAVAMFVVAVWKAARRWAAALATLALLALFVPLGVVASSAGRHPLAAWSHVASLPAFRFPPDSPWVTDGRPVAPRRGSDTLLFQEEHRVTTLAPGPLRILVTDREEVQVQEWTLAAGQSLAIRPGDRLVVDAGRRLRFEANKRVPGAPESGVRWADPPLPPTSTWLLSVAGSGLTLLGGAVALLASEHGPLLPRAGGAIEGIACLLAVAWALGWATYIAFLAPELFLGGVTPEKLFELPALALRGSAWGPTLGDLALVGGCFALLASAAGLRGLLARRATEERNVGLWGAMLAVSALGTYWPLDPWSVLLTGFGLGASTLAPLTLAGPSRERPLATRVAAWTGLSLFLVLAAAGQFVTPAARWAQILLAYPALVASPVTFVLLWLARRPAG
ncbi:MAG: hypothetical protein HY613_01790 [Candidatus Rokubacteria bacterium]|nr:hypothetical protein [Candidatus Rokubacteria bacterium]